MLLVETNLNTQISLLETSNGKPLKFKGIFAKLDHKTENGRVYSRKLWENVINSKITRERLEKRQILGELKHPEYRDIDIEKSAFIITDLSIKDGYVMGEAEVMPHPTLGGILEVFLRHGCQIGISSRGEGSIVEKSGETYVDDKDFELITFDTTLNPAVTEAVPRTVRESVITNLENLKTNSGNSQLKRVISITEDSINSSKSDMENINSKNNLATGVKLGKLAERYKDKLAANVLLMKENMNLKSILENTNLSINSVKDTNSKLLVKSENLLKRYLESKELIKQGFELFENKSNQLDIFKKDYRFLESKFNSVNKKYQKSLNLVEGLITKLDLYENKLADSESTLEAMRESLSELDTKDEEIQNLSEEIENVKESLEERELSESSKNSKLTKQLRTVNSNIQQLSEKVKLSENKNRRLIKENSDLVNRISELTSLLKEARKEIVSRKRNSENSTALSEDVISERNKIRKGLENNHLKSRKSEITNQTRQSFGESSDEDAVTTELMNKMMS